MMPIFSALPRAGWLTRGSILLAGLSWGIPAAVGAQARPEVGGRDSATVVAGGQYRAGGLHRWLFGGVYRKLWTMPIRVPVLDLEHFGGGLTPGKAGGGKQTKSLRFNTPDGAEYVFRSVDKDGVALPEGIKDLGLAQGIARDQTSNSHPAANLVAEPFLVAAGVLHESPVLVVMPDDARLGSFRKQFAHRLGILTLYPDKTRSGVPAFMGALEIIDSDTLVQLLNRNASEQVDGRVFLAARLIDLLLNNYDRHPGNWKWARMQPGGPWLPISRDQDKVLLSMSGVLPHLLHGASATMISFDSTYPGVRSMTFNSLALDQRLLAGLSRPVWDSIAHDMVRRISDSVIMAGMHAMPPEYWSSNAPIAAKLRMRRDSLPAVADRLYSYLAGVVDIHATDGSDHATITRVDDHQVDVQLATAAGETWFARRFDSRDTRSVRLYLHGGDDQALLTGAVPVSLRLRVIGGNGTNTLTDKSRVAGHADVANLYDRGVVSGVKYGADTLLGRRPRIQGVAPGKDHGTAMAPILGLSINRDMGLMPRLGMAWKQYGFRDVPYSSMISIDGRYSLKNSGAAVTLTADHRRPNSVLHFTETVRMSELEVLNYHGLGNSSLSTVGLNTAVTAPRTDFYALHQRQWLFAPSVGLALGPTFDLHLGPVLQYSVTDSTPNRFISATNPYGAGHFGEAGLRATLASDTRVPSRHAHRGTVVDVSATWVPAVLDVQHSFTTIAASGGVYFTLPLPLHPYLGIRGGAKKVFGDFPFQESAFLGGRADVRTLDLQRYAGDAAIYSTAELRVPVAKFSLLIPLNVGLLATEDVGRVFVDGASPGGWHNAFGAGFWVGYHDLTVDIRVMRANEIGRTSVIALRFGLPGVLP